MDHLLATIHYLPLVHEGVSISEYHYDSIIQHDDHSTHSLTSHYQCVSLSIDHLDDYHQTTLLLILFPLSSFHYLSISNH